MSGRIFGYARVSTKNQHEDRQVAALREYGVPEHKIFVEKCSGKDFNRPCYQKLLRRFKPGDTLVISSLDRLGRDYQEIQEQWRIISKEKSVSIVVLDMPLLNTKENMELVGLLIADLVLQLFSFVAQTERENIRRRQREGIEAAKARGVRFGRPRSVLPENFAEIVEDWLRGEYSAEEAARMLGISRSTFFRRVKELERERGSQEPEQAECAAKKNIRSRRRFHTKRSRLIAECTNTAHTESPGHADHVDRLDFEARHASVSESISECPKPACPNVPFRSAPTHTQKK